MTRSFDSHENAESPSEVDRLGLARRLSQVAVSEQRSALTVIALTECVLDAMVVTNLAGEVVAANQATVQLFGYDQNQLKAAKMSVFMTPGSQELYMPQLQRFITRMIRCKEKHGCWLPDCIHFCEERTFSWSHTLEMKVFKQKRESESDYAEPIFLIFVLKDISERKQMEIRKETLLANISHEMRTPISAIIGLAGALVENESNPGRTRHLELIIGKDGVLPCGRLDPARLSKKAPGSLPRRDRDVKVHIPDLDDPHDPVQDMIDPEFPDRFAAFRTENTSPASYIPSNKAKKIMH
ncbi:two component histidine kinase, putative [Perkinsus marinus ATCC 50983]|uniref:Two component histidine kinase, putative n=1 Tax=Perkinsus marinus (strain ATCC 50983 / TXsc) TaxID=423536 RepID=C5KCN5_PERM5|nr:two component histidine kinase, putative [Perkinsus marinus ATCC 50983]EER17634.1 two component histidine kinase, putative [Perkinsus marinus ATCC 50983]|eukprot:XP_002785838.1 two component histidine kinase, putative [Perkinsus marinus ATCC 50983]